MVYLWAMIPQIFLLWVWGVLATVAMLGCSSSFMKVETTTPGAAVFVNDSAAGVTPWVGSIRKDSAHVVIEKNGIVLHDTTFQPNIHGQLLWGGILTSSLASVSVGYYTHNTPLLVAGLGLELLALMAPSLQIDHTLKIPQTAPSPHEPPAFWDKAEIAEVIQYRRSATKNLDTLYHTDSLCYEPARQALWIYDSAIRARKPLDVKQTKRCLPGSYEFKKKDSPWKYIGAGAFMGATTYSLVPFIVGEEFQTAWTISGLIIGTFSGLAAWGFSPLHVRCEEHQDSLAYQQWLMQRTCRIPHASPPPITESLSNGIRVIQLPSPSGPSEPIPSDAFPENAFPPETESPKNTDDPVIFTPD